MLYATIVNQVHVNYETRQLEMASAMEMYVVKESSPLKQVYYSDTRSCNPNPINSLANEDEESTSSSLSKKPTSTSSTNVPSATVNNKLIKRSATVFIKCCDEATINNYKILLQQQQEMQYNSNYYDLKLQTFIENVYEPVVCEYVLNICTELLCTDANNHVAPSTTSTTTSTNNKNNIPSAKNSKETPSTSTRTDSTTINTNNNQNNNNQNTQDEYYTSEELQDRLYSINPSEQLLLREKVRKMFFHGYYGYMNYGWPEGELKPISCTGGPFEPIKLPIVTLIDALDTLAIMVC